MREGSLARTARRREDSTLLLCIPNDPDDPEEFTFRPEIVDAERYRTEWISARVEDTITTTEAR